jgi:hypothetical protein
MRAAPAIAEGFALGKRCANKYPTLARAEIPTQHIFGVFNGRDADLENPHEATARIIDPGSAVGDTAGRWFGISARVAESERQRPPSR